MLPLKKREAIRKENRRQRAKHEKDALAVRVEEAFERVRAFWDLGRNILMDREENVGYGAQFVSSAAARRGINEDYVRKAMLLADEETGFTEAELEAVGRLCKKHRAVLGVGHLLRLLAVPKQDGRRDKMLRQAVEENWSYRTLNDAIRGRYSRRRQGSGRRRRPPRNHRDLLAQLDRQCLAWMRWCAGVATRDARPGQVLPVALTDLPEKLENRIARVTKAVERLQKAVADRLKAKAGKRK